MSAPVARFDPAFPVAITRGAEYNPRKIDDAAITMLGDPIRTIGFCKPIIVLADGLVVAGHQRTRTLRGIGIEACPAIVIEGFLKSDEVTFNQLHNGTDLFASTEPVHVPATDKLGYVEIPGESVQGNGVMAGAGVRSEICRLIGRYGLWGSVVATQSGEVIDAPHYALACRIMGVPCRTYYIPDSLADEARHFLGQTYGVFSYAHLKKTTYIQGLAQLGRLGETGKPRLSTLYEKSAIPAINSMSIRPRVLDFGCGRGDYVRYLQGFGVHIRGLEFYRLVKRSKIDTRAVHAMIDAVLDEVRRNGLFDVVLCDSVLNSVDSPQAHDDVLTVINAFCKPGGRMIYSGRNVEEAHKRMRAKCQTKKKGVRKTCEFLDEHGFTATYRQGHWFYQRYHTAEQLKEMADTYVGPDVTFHGEVSVWHTRGTKSVTLPWEKVRASLGREFNLPWPGDTFVGRSQDAIDAFAPYYEGASA